MLTDEHGSNMQWHRSRNELWREKKGKERMMSGSERAIPETSVTKEDSVPSRHHPGHIETE